jgi:hypothetical protein
MNQQSEVSIYTPEDLANDWQLLQSGATISSATRSTLSSREALRAWWHGDIGPEAAEQMPL